jgi:hypothetical protein
MRRRVGRVTDLQAWIVIIELAVLVVLALARR